MEYNSPSVQSHIFRGVSRVVSRLMGGRTKVEEWRAISAFPSWPTIILPGIQSKSELILGIPCEWLCPNNAQTDKIILYIHGGGFLTGWYNTHRILTSRVALACQANAIAVDYRLAPENPFLPGWRIVYPFIGVCSNQVMIQNRL
jgi:acetyl esterase/lipase